MGASYVLIPPFETLGVLAYYFFMVLASLKLLAYYWQDKEVISIKLSKPLIVLALSIILIYTYTFGMNDAVSYALH